MHDGYGREIDYLRVSVTDRCNLRCRYCMPKEGLPLVSHGDVLTYDEILRVVSIMSDLGVTKIKLTGGEPLVRKNLPTLAKELKNVPGIKSVTLTTNGTLLSKYMKELSVSGIDAVNVSLDTMNAEVYSYITITGGGSLDDVLKGIRELRKYPDIDAKINCVPMGIKGQNPIELLEFAKKDFIHVRFIEMMPVGMGKNFSCFGEDHLKKKIEERYGRLIPSMKNPGNGPCRYYEPQGFLGMVGFISAVSHRFCDGCNRLRLTSQGYLKTCLQYEEWIDLKGPLREGASDEEIRDMIVRELKKKPKGHRFGERDIDREEGMTMSQIGG